jgi:cytochrome P450 StaP
MTTTSPRAAPFPLVGSDDLADPYPVYRRYREQDPIHALPPAAGEPQTWYVFGYQEAARVLSSPAFGRGAVSPHAQQPRLTDVVPATHGALRRSVQNWLVFLDPPRHTRLRALIAAHFTAVMVEDLRPRIDKLASTLLVPMRERPTIDLVADFAAPLPILVIAQLLGIPAQDHRWLREHAIALQEANSSRAGGRPDRFAAAETAVQQLDAYFHTEIQHRRRRRRDDVIDGLMYAADVDGPLSAEEIVATCIHLLTAGHETTTNVISKSVLALLAHPDARRHLRASPRLMPAAVEELIRYDCPVQMVTRWAHRDQQVAGRQIPRGSKVVVVLGSANRDPGQFERPDHLDLHRNAGRHVAFGRGIHYCLGSTLARAEAEIALTGILAGLPGLGRSDEPVVYANDLIFHGPSRLPLRTGTIR